MSVRQQSRSNSYAIALLVIILLLPLEYVLGAMCPKGNHADQNVTADNCCPNFEESAKEMNSDADTDADSNTSANCNNAAGSDTGHCDVDLSAYPACHDCGCFFKPFSENRRSADYGITVTQMFPGLSIDSETPLFTIQNITYRDYPDPGPSSPQIPIYLANQVFLN